MQAQQSLIFREQNPCENKASKFISLISIFGSENRVKFCLNLVTLKLI